MYVSPIDGLTCIVEAGWRTFYPTGEQDESPGLRGPLILLMPAQHELESRVSVDALVHYLKALESEFLRECREQRNIRVDLLVRLGLSPGEPSSGMVRGDLHADAVMEALRSVPSPTVTGGKVILEFRLTTEADDVSPEGNL